MNKSKYKLKFEFDKVSIHVESDEDIEDQLTSIYNNNQNRPYQFMASAATVPGVKMVGTEIS